MRVAKLDLLLSFALALTFAATTSPAQTAVAAESGAPAVNAGTHHSAGASADTPATLATSQYVLGASDVIRVSVWKSPDLSQTVTVGPDGFVSLPLLGDIHAAGMTANELAKDLGTRLGSYVVSPQVTVGVVDFRSRQVFVTGQVGKPGAYSLIAPVTVLQLIAQAGGLNAFANRKAIFVLRAGNGMEKLKFNYISALKGDVKQNINLLPGDTVIVP